jgi:hypothetical protein
VLVLAVSAALPAMAWGPGGHSVIAAGAAVERGIAFPSNHLLLQVIYGATAPDLAWGAGEPLSSALGAATHDSPGCFEPWRLARPSSKAERFFAGAWVSHNQEWGADHYAHMEYPLPSATSEPRPGYVVDRAGLLAASEGVPEEIAHYYIETAVDPLVDQQVPELSLGSMLARASYQRDSRLPSLLAKSYRDVPGASGIVVRLLEAEFRASLAAYGETLALPTGPDDAAFAAGMALLYGMTLQESASCLAAAKALCQDPEAHYADAIYATIDLVAAAPWP